MSTTRTVIIGGVAGGMSAATRLRRNDEHREIVVLERAEHVSFANCGLPYHIGGVIPGRDELLLQTPRSLRERFDLDVRTRQEATGIDTDAHEVTVLDHHSGQSYVLSYDSLVLSTGASPARPPVPGIDRALALRDIADMDAIIDRVEAAGAERAAIIGGGFIGIELAENLRHRGMAVTVVEAAEHVLPVLDVEMAAIMAAHLREHGITLLTGAAVTQVADDGLALADGTEVPADVVLLAAGVTPESVLAAGAGIATGARGGVLVDEQQRTSAAGVYAVGDVAVKRDAVDDGPVLVPLAQTANRHGRLVADIITGRDVRALPVLGTAIVGAFGLTAAAVGWTETRARRAGREIRLAHVHPSDHAGYYPGAEQMTLKLVIDAADDAILGAQGVGGSGVDKRIDVIATAMRGGLRASDLADLELAYAPQYGSAKDPVNMLGMVADNLADGIVRNLQWHELAGAQQAGAQLVDVRGTEEFAAEGALPGSVCLPLPELRARHAELPAGRLVVTCGVGQRGHAASRLLTQLGHDVVNLDGGNRTWHQATAG